MSNKKLVKISTYAKSNNVSATSVYNWIKSGDVCVEVIDGVKFINVEKSKREINK